MAQVLSVIAAPALTRIYTPADFGVLAVFTAGVTLALTVVGLRYELAIPIAGSEVEAAQLLLLTMISVLGTSVLLALGLLFVGDHLLAVTRAERLAGFLWLVPLGVLLGGVYQSLRYYAIRARAYRVLAGTTLQQGVGRVLVQLGLGAAIAGPAGLLLGHVTGVSAGIVRLTRDARARLSTVDYFWRYEGIAATARRYRRYPVLMTGSSLLNSAGLQIAPVLMAAYFGSGVAGVYFLTQKILGVPVQLLGQSVRQVFLGEAAESGRTTKGSIAVLFRGVSLRLLLIAVLPVVAIVAFGPAAFAFVFGDEWRDSGVFARYLAPVYLLKLTLDSTINMTLVGREDLAFAWSLFRLLAVYGTVAGAAHLELSASATVLWLAIAYGGAYLVKFALWMYALRLQGSANQ